jgi:hypothetical protein
VITTIYVAEIDGRPVAALSALYGPEDIIDTDWFQSELMVLEEDGKPVWDGKSDITVRPATDTERATLEASRAEAIDRGAVQNPNEDWVLFLVDVRERNQ